ncbi:cation:dicarboxylate symporter family transporter [Piscirickettsia salmonis]|uniref:cation:dicarboxylate symporter family transporter n=1 Tax=Piscirickettsia salmonis TaxID=1238 RepID=UPI0007C97C10|nr:L-cystine uptake protein TcyP [Piscirickettsiaceae bacterium NZ-RLO1]
MSALVLSKIYIFIFIVLLFSLYGLQRKGMKFNGLVLIALITGVGLGALARFSLVSDHFAMADLNSVFHLVGEGYIDLLKMLVIPLVFTSLVSALLSLSDKGAANFRLSAIRFVVMLLVLTGISAGIGMLVGMLFNLGAGLVIPGVDLQPSHHYTGVVDTILGMLPTNPIAAMASGNAAALALFSIFIGAAALVVKKSKIADIKPFEGFIQSTFEISKQLARFVVALTPYGVLALIANVASATGASSLLSVLSYLVAIYVAMALVFALHLAILAAQGISPTYYLKHAYKALLVAFTTRSSFGTLPVAEETLRQKFKIHPDLATFAPTIGSSIGFNACAGVFPAMLVVMAMTIMHEPVTWQIIVMVMFINAIASLGISGIPGTASIAAAVTLSTLGLPYAIIAIVQGVDPIVDMGRTATNVNGVMASALTVDKYLATEETQANSIKAEAL